MRNRSDPLESLNDYLDTLAGSPPADSAAADLAPDVREGVDRFFGLAQQAPITPPNLERSTMPMPSRPARPIGSQPNSPDSMKQLIGKRPNRLHAWVSAAAVALLLVAMAGGAWMLNSDRGGSPQQEPLQLAALPSDNGTPDAIWPEPLTMDDAPWIASIAPEECTAEPMSFEAYASAKTTDPGPPQGSHEIIGAPDPVEAQAAVSVLRGWLACGDLGSTKQIRSYYTTELIFYSDVSIDNAPYQDALVLRRSEAERQWTLWAQDTNLYPLSLVEGIEPPPEALESFEAAQNLIDQGQALSPSIMVSPDGTMAPYFEARFDPEEAVMLADGRMMMPTTYIYWSEDPWVQTYGFSPAPNTSSLAVVLKNVDGDWKIDETDIFICFGQCDDALGENMATPVASPAATPPA